MLPLFVAVMLTGNGFGNSREKKEEKARELMQKAAELSQLGVADVPPFHLYINFKLGGLVSGPGSGRYSWVSASPNQWRREIEFSGYSDIEVGNGGTIWRKRSLDFTPQSASWIHTLISNFAVLVLLDGEKVDGVYRESGLQCISLRSHREYRILCFNPSGTLRSVLYPDENTVYAYSDYKSFGQKLFPYILVVRSHNRVVVDAAVEDLDLERTLDSGLFQPPAGTERVPGCLNPTPGGLISSVEPNYPNLARSQGRRGSVYLSIHIGRDGSVTDPRVLGTAGGDLDEAAIAAVRQWKYSPFMCGGVAVEIEKAVTVNFSWAKTH